MTKSAEQLKAEVVEDLKRLDKENHAFHHHKKGSKRRHQAKIRILRLQGLLHGAQNELAKVLKEESAGRIHAVRYAQAHIGVSEHPAGSNSGPQIDAWAKAMGFPGSHVFWCGIFAGYCVVFAGKAKIPAPYRLASGSYIINDARRGENGLHLVQFGAIEKGDLLSYWNGEHIGIAAGRPINGVVHTVEGNTSPSSAGSQYNGGCVAPKTKSASDITVAARPQWR
jgi:hypothetical protein